MKLKDYRRYRYLDSSRLVLKVCFVLLLVVVNSITSTQGYIKSANRLFQRSYNQLFSSQSSPASASLDNAGALGKHFIKNIVEEDIRSNKNGGRVVTRFPPEPNGYLHLGHAKSICLNFGLAKQYGGVTNMRFDDTNPAKEDMEYVNSILDDVRWLVTGDKNPSSAPWDGNIRHASDYFQVLFEAAVYLIQKDLAYVDNLTPDEMKAYRGTLTEPGRESPFRQRSINENLQLFQDMKDGKFPDGHCVLRAKIDMSSPNMNMRDPTLYRIKRATHPITGDAWCIYPMYDYAHAISDAMEGITHSLCTLEFADHRPLYDWTIDQVGPTNLLPYASKGWRPTQIEFSRLNLQYTVLSKRKLIQLVTEKHVEGWDDPRMPTISGVRRRGFPAAAIQLFCDRIGISKAENNIDMSVLEECVRETLDLDAPRALAVLNPLKATISNWPEGAVEVFNAESHPKRTDLGSRAIPFSGSVFIDHDDFFDTGLDGSLSPPKGFKRLLLGGQVRLKYAYVVTCDSLIRDPVTGKVVELICSYDDRTRHGATPADSKRVKGIIQWISAAHGIPAEVKLYDRLFSAPSPGKDHDDGDFLRDINPDSVTSFPNSIIEPSLQGVEIGCSYQFERLGYFCLDPVLNNKEQQKPIFNRIVTLKDTWMNADSANTVAVHGTTIAAAKVAEAAPPKVIEDVRRIDIRVGKILSVEAHPDAESLYVEKIDCGDSEGPRTVVSGLAKFFSKEELLGRNVLVVCNLKPATMRGIQSDGMLLAASSIVGDSEVVEVVSAPVDAIAGEKVRVDGFAAPEPDVQLKSKTAQDCFKRVIASLKVDGSSQAVYSNNNQDCKLTTSAGVCFVQSLKEAAIR